jgi:Neprosin
MSNVGNHHRCAPRALIVSSLALYGAAPFGLGCGTTADNPETTGTKHQALAVVDISAPARAAEVAAYLDETYFSRFTVLATTRGPFGETVDWVDPHELDPDCDARTPPPVDMPSPEDPPIGPGEQGEPPDLTGVELAENIIPLWEEANRGAPPGAVLLIRQNFDAYISGVAEASDLNEFIANISSPQPAGQTNLHAGRTQPVTNIGTQGWIEYPDIADVPNDGMSLAQLAIYCAGTDALNTSESVEFGIQKSPNQYSEPAPANTPKQHLFSYFSTAGYKPVNLGNYKGGYNTTVAGFVPCLINCTATGGAAPFGPGAVLPTPPPGVRHDRRLRVLRSAASGTISPAYWLLDYLSPTAYTFLGYYPIGTSQPNINFDVINTAACQVDWYGEAFDPTPTNWSNVNIGNGIQGTLGTAPRMHGTQYYPSVTSSQWFSTGAVDKSEDLACYSSSLVVADATPNYERTFHYGGPGGDAAGCD